jgi:hypothetical protein
MGILIARFDLIVRRFEGSTSNKEQKGDRMKKSGFVVGSAKSRASSKLYSQLLPLIILGAITVTVVGVVAIGISGFSNKVLASPEPPASQDQDKKFIATKNIIVDEASGKLRRPNKTELKELVDYLLEKTKRSTADHKTVSLSNGTQAIDLNGGFEGVILARPNIDGSSEVKCVFTFEEGAEFLGLEEVDS